MIDSERDERGAEGAGGRGADVVHRGCRFDGEDPATLAGALSAIVDYRGDVTITRRSTADPIAGYVFDCTRPEHGANGVLRLLPADGGIAIGVPLDDVAAIEVTGRDTAEGRSFETWVRNYVRKKQAGEPANIDADPLEEPHEKRCASS